MKKGEHKIQTYMKLREILKTIYDIYTYYSAHKLKCWAIQTKSKNINKYFIFAYQIITQNPGLCYEENFRNINKNVSLIKSTNENIKKSIKTRRKKYWSYHEEEKLVSYRHKIKNIIFSKQKFETITKKKGLLKTNTY